MRKQLAIILFAVMALAASLPQLFAQASGTVKGTCKDAQGTPIAGAVVEWTNLDNGQKYNLKTNKNGEYFSLGLTPGKYKITLYKTPDDQKANKELYHINGFQDQLDENTMDIDLKKEQESADKGQGLSPEQLKQMQEKQAKAQKETLTDKQLNEKRSAAKTEADAKSNKVDDAVKTYELAAQADPPHASQYYFNTGAVLTNAGKVDDAITSFDKVIAADPNRADAYYWKGVNLIGKATLKGDKMDAPAGTAEAFQKYLELQPTGTFADAAKQMLGQIGGSVETTFGKKKAAKK